MSEEVFGMDRSDSDDYPLDNHDGAVPEMGSDTADAFGNDPLIE